jgi:hypothetical protein
VPRFISKKLPPHWIYVPSRRQVRTLLNTLVADVRCVQFDGTGRHPGPVGMLLGYLERRVIEKAWCFYLRFWGVPEAAVADQRDALAAVALRAIGDSVAECLAQPAADVIKPTHLLLRFSVQAANIVAKCTIKPVDKYSFSAGCWWASSGGAEQKGGPQSPLTDDPSRVSPR